MTTYTKERIKQLIDKSKYILIHGMYHKSIQLYKTGDRWYIRGTVNTPRMFIGKKSLCNQIYEILFKERFSVEFIDATDRTIDVLFSDKHTR